MKKYIFIFAISVVLTFLMLPVMSLFEEENEGDLTLDTFGTILEPNENPLIIDTNENTEGNQEGNVLKETNKPNLDNKEKDEPESYRGSDNIYVKPIPNAVGDPVVEPIPRATEEHFQVEPLPNPIEEQEEYKLSDYISGL